MLNKTDAPSIWYKEIGVGSKHIGLAAGAPNQGVASGKMMKLIGHASGRNPRQGGFKPTSELLVV